MANRQLLVLIHLGGWSVFLLVFALIFSRFYPFSVSLFRAVLNTLPMVALFYINLYLVDRFFERNRYLQYFGYSLLLIAVLSLLRVQINLQFPEIDQRAFLPDSDNNSWWFGAVGTNLLILAMSTFYQILNNRNQIEQRNLVLVKEQNEAQLQFLRAQINPHFLFNTLNNIYSLAVLRSERTADMVLRLSALLRYVIYDSQEELVPLSRELEQIRQFVELFCMRSEEQPDIRLEVKGNLDGVMIEPMILIPFVENCFKHCDFETNDRAFVEISLQVNDEEIRFQTRNTKDERHVQKDKVGGVGLDNIRRRLALKYPERHLLVTDNQPDRFYLDLRLQPAARSLNNNTRNVYDPNTAGR